MKDNNGLFLSLTMSLTLAIFFCSEAVFSLFSDSPKVVGSENAEIWAFVWGHFWFKEAILTDGAWPMYTDLSNFPVGGALWLKDPFSLFFMFPIQLLFGIPVAVVTSQIIMFVLSSTSSYLLCRQLDYKRFPSIIGGIIFGFCPHSLGEAFNGNLEALNTGFLPLWLFSWLLVMEKISAKRVFFSGISLAFLLVSNQYWAIAMAMSAIPIVLWKLYTERERWLTIVLGSIFSVSLGLLLFAPAGWWIWQSLHHPKRLNDITNGPVDLVVPYLSDFKHFLFPMADLMKVSAPLPPFQDLIYIGLGFSCMALLAPLLYRKSWVWLYTGLGFFFVLLSFGPALSYDGALVSPNGENMLALPWWYLISKQPALSWMTLPHRMIIPATLFLMLAFVATIEKFRFGGYLLAVLSLLEIWLYPPYQLPLLTTSLPSSPHTQILKQIPEKGAVLNLPVNLTSNKMRKYYWYQCQHERPIAMSLRYSEYPSIGETVALVEQSRFLMESAPEDPATDPMNLKELKEAGYRFVVLHGEYIEEFSPHRFTEYLPKLEYYLGQGYSFIDDTVVFPLYEEDRKKIEMLIQSINN